MGHVSFWSTIILLTSGNIGTMKRTRGILVAITGVGILVNAENTKYIFMSH